MSLRRLQAFFLVCAIAWLSWAAGVRAAATLPSLPAPTAESVWHCSPENDRFYHWRCDPVVPDSVPPFQANGVALSLSRVEAFVDRHDPVLWVDSVLPATVTGPAWRVPVFNIPFDPRDLETLLRAVMCRGTAGCRIHVGERPL